MPVSPDTTPVPISTNPGVKYAITADNGDVTIDSIVAIGSEAYEYPEGIVTGGAGNRLFYQGPATSLKVTPSAAGVFWTVTPCHD